jgi:hypothetical protein
VDARLAVYCAVADGGSRNRCARRTALSLGVDPPGYEVRKARAGLAKALADGQATLDTDSGLRHLLRETREKQTGTTEHRRRSAVCGAYLSLDLAWLRRRNMLTPGRRSSVVWSAGGNQVGDITIVALEDTLLLVYRTRSRGEAWRHQQQEVPFTATATAFDGCRRWFACPQCQRPCRVRYGNTRFLGRRCWGIGYRSQRESDDIKRPPAEAGGHLACFNKHREAIEQAASTSTNAACKAVQ